MFLRKANGEKLRERRADGVFRAGHSKITAVSGKENWVRHRCEQVVVANGTRSSDDSSARIER